MFYYIICINQKNEKLLFPLAEVQNKDKFVKIVLTFSLNSNRYFRKEHLVGS